MTALSALAKLAPLAGRYVLGRLSDPGPWANAASDWAAQKAGGNCNGELNLTSISANFFIPGKLNTLLAPALGSGFEYTNDDGFKRSFILGDKTATRSGLETGFGIIGNYLSGKYGGKLGSCLRGAGTHAGEKFGLELFLRS